MNIMSFVAYTWTMTEEKRGQFQTRYGAKVILFNNIRALISLHFCNHPNPCPLQGQSSWQPLLISIPFLKPEIRNPTICDRMAACESSHPATLKPRIVLPSLPFSLCPFLVASLNPAFNQRIHGNPQTSSIWKEGGTAVANPAREMKHYRVCSLNTYGKKQRLRKNF